MNLIRHVKWAGMALLLATGCAGTSGSKDAGTGTKTAMATLNEPEGAQGTVVFEETSAGTQVTVHLNHVPKDGLHGIHLHANGECGDTMDGGTHHGGAGGHFNPDNVAHGCPPAMPHHAGDFGNIQITNGSGTATLVTKELTVSPGPRSVVGKAFILHADPDDCTSQPSGNSGARIGCAVIK